MRLGGLYGQKKSTSKFLDSRKLKKLAMHTALNCFPESRNFRCGPADVVPGGGVGCKMRRREGGGYWGQKLMAPLFDRSCSRSLVLRKNKIMALD